MLRVHSQPALDLPWLAPYRTLRAQGEHLRNGILVAEGDKAVRRLLESPLRIVSALMTPEWFGRLGPLFEARSETGEIGLLEHGAIEALTGFSFFQGLLVVAEIPAPRNLADVLAEAAGSPLLLALDGLTNSDNLGTILRTARAMGVSALIQGEGCASPFLRRSVRGSMGAVFELPVVATADLAGTLRDLAAAGIRGVAAHPAADGASLFDCDLRGGCCIVLGHEGHGIRPEVRAACSAAVAIPMAAPLDSLNVAGCAAMFLYEAARQRRNAPR
jgi:tRNA G18 (ribose-2'-O)-methylase SpoU